MRSTILALVLALAGGGALAAGFAGGNGSSQAAAVVITGATSDSDGIAAEYAWIAANRPGAVVLTQGLIMGNGRAYDVLTIQIGGNQQQIWFDITGFFGR